MQNNLEIRGLEKEYASFHLGPIDVEIPKGSIVGLIGENGAGKSTLIKSVLGLVHSKGEVYYFSQKLTRSDRKPFETIGISLEELYLPGELTIEKVHVLCRKMYALWEEEVFQSYLTRFQLDPKKKVEALSRGMRMKLSLSIALSHGSKLLLLDEPTSGLDPIVREEILDLLLEFIQEQEHSVLISSHILSDLEKVADYIAFIHKGKLVFFEEKDRLREKYALYAPPSGEMVSRSDAFIALRQSSYSKTYLVLRKKMPHSADLMRASIEDIMLYLVKGERL